MPLHVEFTRLRRPYFPAERVIEGLFETAKRLYGVRIEPRDGLPTWDASVRSYRMFDKDGTDLAVFYLDIYPRENKRDGDYENQSRASPKN